MVVINPDSKLLLTYVYAVYQMYADILVEHTYSTLAVTVFLIALLLWLGSHPSRGKE